MLLIQSLNHTSHILQILRRRAQINELIYARHKKAFVPTLLLSPVKCNAICLRPGAGRKFKKKNFLDVVVFVHVNILRKSLYKIPMRHSQKLVLSCMHHSPEM